MVLHIPLQKQRCDAARLSETENSAFSEQAVYANRGIIILNTKGKTRTLQTDKEGNLHVTLRAGEYEFYEEWRYNLYTPQNQPIEAFDMACLKAEWQKMLYKVQVSRKNSRIKAQYTVVDFCPWNLPCLLLRQIPPGR